MTGGERSPIDGVRKYFWWTTIGAASAVVLLAALALVGQGSTTDWLVLAPSTAVVAALYIRVTLSSMPGVGTRPAGRWAGPVGLTVATAAWCYTAAGGLWVALPALALGGVAAASSGRARWALVWGGSAVIGAASLVIGEPERDGADPVRGLVGVVVITVVFSASNVLQTWLWAIIVEIDRARHTAAELAVAKERLRFAAELHDVQGHHLQAIALKAELAERLVGVDDAAARANAAEVGDLARKALGETRAVVHGYRRTGLAGEITNAVDVLRAAGVDARVDGDPQRVPPALQALFGALVREGTTNILRHSAATDCVLAVSADGGRIAASLTNDGVRTSVGVRPDDDARPDRTASGGSGLDSLRERFAAVGGFVTTTADDERFTLAGEVLP